MKTQVERKYEERGLNNHFLRTGDDLTIHNIDIKKIEGYASLSDEKKKLFEKAVVSFFNAWGLEKRDVISPSAVYYVQDTEYIDSDDLLVAKVVKAISKDGRSHIIHNDFFKATPLSECRECISEYLRFELKGEWFHITDDGLWY